MGNKVLVTGGAGFIGSHLVDALLRRGDTVRVLDNLLPQAHPSGKARFLSPEAELIVGDLRDRAAVDRALDGIDTVFHQGGMVGNGQSMYDIQRYTDVNVTGTANLVEAMVSRRAQFRKFVVASSMVVYGDGAYRCAVHGVLQHAVRPETRLRARQWEPLCPACGAEVQPTPTSEEHAQRPTSTYGTSKRAQEELCLVLGRAYKMPTVALRYLNTYGSRQALQNPYTGVAAIMSMRLLNNKAPVIFEDGAQLRDLTHVSDVVAANIAAAEAGPEADYEPFNIGTGRSVTVLHMARTLAKKLGREIEPEVTGQFREGDIRHCLADVSKARRLLSWEARVTFDDGADELATWAAGERPADLTEKANAELREKGLIR
ncbi:MAG: SDR family NAD(P)-dependent oxidoreductase [Myxococcota bacterium]